MLLSVPTIALAGERDDQPLTLMSPQQPADKTAQQQQTLQQNEDIHDIHGPIPIAGQPPYLAITISILLILAILAAIIFWLKKRRKPGPPTPFPWETALAELAAAKALQTGGQGLLYMERASQVLRRYIESRFAIRSTRQTTGEFLAGLGHAGNNSPLEEYRPELQVCLEQADMAKFAHQVPDLNNMARMEFAVTDFVKKTEPITTPAGGKT